MVQPASTRSLVFVSAKHRPDLAERARTLDEEVWPEYNRHGDFMSPNWDSLYDFFPEFQFVVHDGQTNQVVAEGHTIPCRWDGMIDGLPDGIDGLFEAALRLRNEARKPTALAALAVEIPPREQGRELSGLMLQHMRTLAAGNELQDLIVPVRPNWKERYPLTPIERYARWTREDGLPFDPWIRVHHRLGADFLKAEPRSLRITGSVADWEAWTLMRFPESGDYVFPHGLAPVAIDVQADIGAYWEPNVWMRHRVD